MMHLGADMTQRSQALPDEGAVTAEQFVRFWLRYSDSIFLISDPAKVDEFFDRLSELPSPLKEETFVRCCLSGTLSINFDSH